MATLPPELLTFMGELAEHNEREWFNTNKPRYEAEVKEPALAFIADFADDLHGVSEHFLAVPKTQGGSLFRIFRDTRFSKDKTPYKTNTGMNFRHQQASRDVHAPGFYLHLAPGDCGAGAGMWMPPTPALRSIRDAIVADPERWSDTRAELASSGLQFMRDDASLKRVPRGYDADHVHGDDLRRKTLAVFRPLLDSTVTAPEFANELAQTYRDAAPLVEFLCDAVGLPF